MELVWQVAAAQNFIRERKTVKYLHFRALYTAYSVRCSSVICPPTSQSIATNGRPSLWHRKFPCANTISRSALLGHRACECANSTAVGSQGQRRACHLPRSSMVLYLFSIHNTLEVLRIWDITAQSLMKPQRGHGFIGLNRAGRVHGRRLEMRQNSRSRN